MSSLNEEEVALYAILNGQKEALKHLQVREGDMQTYLSKFLARNEPAPFFKKIRQLLLQIMNYMDPDEISQHYQISQPILKLINSTSEAEDQQENLNILEIISHKKRKEGDVENTELLLNFKRYKNDGNTSQYEEEDYTMQGQHHPAFPPEDQIEVNEKKRNKRTKLNIDDKMIEHLKLVQEDVLKVKDVADKYKVSPACIYQIMRTHGFIAPNKGRGRKSTSEIEQQYMQVMNQGGQQALPKPPINDQEIYEPQKMQQNQGYSHMSNQQSYNPNQLIHPGSLNSPNLTSQLLHSQVQQNLGNSIQMSQLGQSMMNQGSMQSPSMSMGSYMQSNNLGPQMMSGLQSQQLMSSMDQLHYGNDCLSSQQGMGMMGYGSQQDNLNMQMRRHEQQQYEQMGLNEESKQLQEEEEDQDKSEGSEDNNDQEEENRSEENQNNREEEIENEDSESERTEAMDD